MIRLALNPVLTTIQPALAGSHFFLFKYSINARMRTNYAFKVVRNVDKAQLIPPVLMSALKLSSPLESRAPSLSRNMKRDAKPFWMGFNWIIERQKYTMPVRTWLCDLA